MEATVFQTIKALSQTENVKSSYYYTFLCYHITQTITNTNTKTKNKNKNKNKQKQKRWKHKKYLKVSIML